MAVHVNNWYEGLDENSRAIVDALSKQGADLLLADPEVGVVAEGDPLITAFSANDMTLARVADGDQPGTRTDRRREEGLNHVVG